MLFVEWGCSLAPCRTGQGGYKCSLVVLDVLQGERSMEPTSEMRVWEGAGQERFSEELTLGLRSEDKLELI